MCVCDRVTGRNHLNKKSVQRVLSTMLGKDSMVAETAPDRMMGYLLPGLFISWWMGKLRPQARNGGRL